MKDFLAIPELSSDSVIKRVPFIEAVWAIGAEYGPPMKFKSTGRFVFQRITGETARELVKWVDRSPDKSKCRISMYSMGGVISDTGADGSAFYYRNAQYIMGISAAWEKDRDAASFKRWVGRGFQFMRSFSKGTYANFPYSELNDYEREYYGTHTFRLRKIKRKYDPENFFHFQQSIR
ncbi:BBE domain-containing protein [Peribacillus sp. B-H-3]|uniref:BBE domain-containing protein n=1 Tax=Peribacillus sp. B-H-3 TaxID=3400420 RepID=UPI003B01FB60